MSTTWRLVVLLLGMACSSGKGITVPFDSGPAGTGGQATAGDSGPSSDVADVSQGGVDVVPLATGLPCDKLVDGLVGRWRGDGDYTDSVGANAGTNAGAVTFAEGVLGEAFAFDGSASSYVQIPDAASLRLAGPFTIDAWINPMVSNGRIFDKIAAGTANGYNMDLLGGQLRIQVGAEWLVSGVPIPMGGFSHVTGIYTGSGFQVYLNGVLVAAKSTTVTAVPTSALPVRVGADSTGGTLYAGLIDDLRVYGRALSATEVQAIHQVGAAVHCGCSSPPADLVSWWRGEGSFADAMNSNMGMDGGGVAFAAGAVGSGFSLSGGTGAYVTVPDAPSLMPSLAITLEAWINPGSGSGRLVDKVSSGVADGYYLDLVGGQLRFGVGNDSISGTATNTLAVGRFSHVAGVYDGANLRVYINGVRVGDKVTSLPSIPPNTAPLTLGSNALGASRYTGVLDEIRLYARALGADELLKIYQAGASARCQ